MRHCRTFALTVAAASALAVAAPLPARAVSGFTIGLEGANGDWSADPQEIVDGSGGALDLATATAFTAPLHGRSRNGVHLHLGWNVKGHVLIEGVLQASAWSPFGSARGGTGLTGARVTWFPTNLLLETKRPFDLGLELGGGYSIAGGPTFGMDGLYYAFGAMGEYYPVSWFSLAIGYRYFMPQWDRFFVDYDRDITFDVKDFSAGWGTVTLGLNFHLAAPEW